MEWCGCINVARCLDSARRSHRTSRIAETPTQPFQPVSLHGLTPAQAIDTLIKTRAELPGVPLIAVLPENASRDLTAVAAEHADAVLPHGGDFRDALADVGLPDPAAVFRAQGITVERDAKVEQWILDVIEPCLPDGINAETLAICAIMAWNSTLDSPSDADALLRQIADAVADGDDANVPYELMKQFATSKRKRFRGDKRTIVDHTVERDGDDVSVTAMLAVIPPDTTLRTDAPQSVQQAQSPPPLAAVLGQLLGKDNPAVLLTLTPFDAFARDADALNVEEDEPRLPIRWLAAAQVSLRLREANAQERKQLLHVWVSEVANQPDDGVWHALTMPGIVVRDLASAEETLLGLATQALDGGAVYLAYSIALNARLTLMDRGPAGVRGRATFLQASILRKFGLADEAHMTFEAAREDAIRANDRELEARVVASLNAK